jgi:hypothetical protein
MRPIAKLSRDAKRNNQTRITTVSLSLIFDEAISSCLCCFSRSRGCRRVPDGQIPQNLIFGLASPAFVLKVIGNEKGDIEGLFVV